MAKYLGVKHPERIRLRIYEDLPVPTGPGIANEFSFWTFAVEESERIIESLPRMALKPLAQTAGYGIAIAAHALKAWYGFSYRQILCHEMVHVGQCERAGSLAEFVRLTAWNNIQYGYDGSSVEVEAHKLGKAAALRWCELTGEVERQTKITMERVPEWRKRLEQRFAKRD